MPPDREEAKLRMTTNWKDRYPDGQIVDALLDDDTATLDEMRAYKGRVEANNVSVHAAVDAADQTEYERLVGAFTHYTE